jgi:hypothetical protein
MFQVIWASPPFVRGGVRSPTSVRSRWITVYLHDHQIEKIGGEVGETRLKLVRKLIGEIRNLSPDRLRFRKQGLENF